MNEEEGASFDGGNAGLVINMADVPDAPGFEALPKGMYEVEIENLEFVHAASSGRPMWKWELVIHTHTNPEYVGRKFFYNTVWDGKALPLTRKSVLRVWPELATVNLNVETWPSEPNNWMGKRARARVGIQMYKPEGADKPQPSNSVKELFAATAASSF